MIDRQDTLQITVGGIAQSLVDLLQGFHLFQGDGEIHQ